MAYSQQPPPNYQYGDQVDLIQKPGPHHHHDVCGSLGFPLTRCRQDDQGFQKPSAALTSHQAHEHWRDPVWGVLFVVHLVATIILFIVGLVMKLKSGSDSSTATTSPPPTSGGFIDSQISSGDLVTMFLIWAGSGAVAAGLSAVWMLIMRAFPKQLIYIALGFNILIYFTIAIVSFAFQQVWSGVIFLFMGLFMCLFFFIWRSRIPFAKEMLKYVIDTVNDFPATLVAGYIGLVALYIWTAFWVATVIFTQVMSPSVAYGLGVYLIFSFYWVVQVIKNVVHMTVSGLCATVYFLRGSDIPMPPNPTAASAGRAMTSSFGSVCLGSLLVALLQTLRALVSSLRGDNYWVACIADCILGCIENLLRYFNKYAFTQCAIYGKSYCQAAKATYDLIFSHGFEAVVNDNLIGFVLTMGCLFGAAATAATGAIAAAILIKQYWILVCVISFFIGFSMFLIVSEVIESGVATYFVCFAQDPAILQRNNPDLYHKLVSTYNVSWGI